MKQTITMTLERETKGALRYSEGPGSDRPDDKGYLIGTLYLRKAQVAAAFNQGAAFAPAPRTIEVTVEGK